MLLANGTSAHGQLDEARLLFAQSLETRRQLVARDPDNVSWRVQIPYTYLTMANSELAAQHMPLGVSDLELARADLDALYKIAPTHARVLELRQIALLGLCEALPQIPRLQDALEACDAAKGAARARHKQPLLDADLAGLDRAIGLLQSRLSRLDDAAATFAEATRLGHELVTAEPTNEMYEAILGQALDDEGQFAAYRNQPADAEAKLREAHDVYRVAASHGDGRLRLSLANVCLELAQMLASKSPDDAKAFAREGRDILEALSTAGQLPTASEPSLAQARKLAP